MRPLTPHQARFVEEFLVDFRPAAAMRRAGYSSLSTGCRVLDHPSVKAALAARWAEKTAGAPLPETWSSLAQPAPDWRVIMADPDRRPLTPRQARFVEEYMIDANAAAAGRRAGYRNRLRDANSYRLLRAPAVRAALRARLADRSTALGVSADRVLAGLAKVAFADPRDIFGPDGRLRPFDEMPDDALATITWRVRRRPAAGGDGGQVEDYVFNPHCRMRALNDLGRHLGLFHKPLRGTPSDERPDPAPAWSPLPGPQTLAYASSADVIGYGGAAGGGKTDLGLGLALTRHRVSAIFRREATQLAAVIDRLADLNGGRAGYNASERVWRLAGRQIEFGSAPHPGDERRYQGRPKDLLVLDEAANFLESQARFLMGWVRTTDPAQKCTVLMTFNPPAGAEGRWIVGFFAPWLDDKHPNPAQPGELRWFASVDGRDVEVPDGRAFVLEGGAPTYDFDAGACPADAIVRPQSRTFFPSRVADNPHLAGTGYMATLQALPEPLRSQMLEGDFTAGLEDDLWQVIPTAWVDAAMARWREAPTKGPMDSMGVDVARGGRDQTIIARRHGAWFDALICLDGPQTPDGPTLAAQVIQHRRDRSPVHIDVVGWGASPYDFLTGNNVQAVAVNGAARSSARTAEAHLSFANLRAQIWWRMREALDPNAEPPLSLPPDPALRADLCAPRWKQAAGGILIEAKPEIIARIGRSPDRGDAVVMALMATVKAGQGERGRTGPTGSWMG